MGNAENVMFSWYLTGVEQTCDTVSVTPANACGIHIHEGTTCSDKDAVGGHYYSTTDDPWSSVVYTTQFSPAQTAQGNTEVDIGAGEDIVGRAFVVHAKLD